MNTPLIKATRISTQTNEGRILSRNLSFEVNAGDVLLITGPNGIGKSTLLRALVGNDRLSAGRIHSPISPSKIGFLPQLQNTDFHLPLTLRDILENASNRSISDAEILQWQLLTSEQLNLSWKTASGGERKRTLLTRILITQPELLVLDEPMNHLDLQSRVQVEHALHKFIEEPTQRGKKRAVILVSHEKSLGHLVELRTFKKLKLEPLQGELPEESDDAQ